MSCDYGEVLKNNAADGIKVDEPNTEVLPCLAETCLTAKNTKIQHVYPLAAAFFLTFSRAHAKKESHTSAQHYEKLREAHYLHLLVCGYLYDINGRNKR